MGCIFCRFREIVAKLKSMAQVLRPLPKRRASQIVTQTSAASSQPSSQAPNSHPNSVQLPNIKECAALAEQPVVPTPSVPKAEDSTSAAAGAAVNLGASTPKTEAGADRIAGDAGASTPETQTNVKQGAVDAKPSTLKSEASTDQVAVDAGASTPKVGARAVQATPDSAAAGDAGQATDAGQDNVEKPSGPVAASLLSSAEEQAKQEGAEKPSGDKPQKDEYVSPFEQAQEPAPKQGLSPFANMS